MAVTAFPVILVDSTDGAASDTACSGAGPATALTGSAATTDGAGTLVSLDGSPDLSGVATDGSHVLYYHDTTTGARRFAAINAKDDGADTVTVEQALAVSHAASSWAIGGVRATAHGTESKLLHDNNSSAGDAMPGWTVEMQSGHTETISTLFDHRRAGNVTDGAITLRGESGAATVPIITSSSTGACFRPLATHIAYKDFEIRNSNATKTSSTAIQMVTSNVLITIDGIICDHATDYFNVCIDTSGEPAAQVRNCRLKGNTYGIDWSNGGRGMVVEYCYIHDCGSHGILIPNNGNRFGHPLLDNCIFDSNTGAGIYYQQTSTNATYRSGLIAKRCTFYSNADGIEITVANLGPFAGMVIENCIFASNSGYGIDASGSPGAGLLSAAGAVIDSNCFYSNTSGTINPSALSDVSTNEVTTDPTFGDAANGDFTVGTNMKALGYPGINVGQGSSRSYQDIGAVQREEPAAGGGGTTVPQGLHPIGAGITA